MGARQSIFLIHLIVAVGQQQHDTPNSAANTSNKNTRIRDVVSGQLTVILHPSEN